MDKKQNNLLALSYPGIGLILGSVLGIIFGPVIFDETSKGLVLGSSFGLMAGAIAYNLTKRSDADRNQ